MKNVPCGFGGMAKGGDRVQISALLTLVRLFQRNRSTPMRQSRPLGTPNTGIRIFRIFRSSSEETCRRREDLGEADTNGKPNDLHVVNTPKGGLHDESLPPSVEVIDHPGSGSSMETASLRCFGFGSVENL